MSYEDEVLEAYIQEGEPARCTNCGCAYSDEWVGTTCTACDGKIERVETQNQRAEEWKLTMLNVLRSLYHEDNFVYKALVDQLINRIEYTRLTGMHAPVSVYGLGGDAASARAQIPH